MAIKDLVVAVITVANLGRMPVDKQEVCVLQDPKLVVEGYSKSILDCQYLYFCKQPVT
jgi:hypothetical protein